jgi:putative hydrolase of the HAD superfamily
VTDVMDAQLAILDLGNVLFEADFEKTMRFWSRLSGTPVDRIRDRFAVDNQLELFERGEIPEAAFFALLAGQLRISISRDAMIAGWNAIYGDVMPQSYQAIRSLAGIIPCVALTNTNSTHCPVWQERYRHELGVFRKVYISSDLGMRKPEQRIFEHVLGDWGVPPDRAVFFDDREDNLLGARALGIETVRVTSDAQVPAWVAAHMHVRGGIDGS